MPSTSSEPTIAAIATPPGPGGIGIIRISGDKALAIATTLFKPASQKELRNRHLTYGHIVAPQTGKMVDEVLAVYMRAPHTYTREDVVEFHCHGSYLVLQEVLQLILQQGALLAAPGEFTKRAFLHGRIDLTKAEAVMAMLEAKSSNALDMARRHLSGSLCEEIQAIAHALARCRSTIEVAIDFPDEDVEIIQPQAMARQLEQEVIAPLEKLIQAADRGRVYREGVSVVILGRPNVGKSSLLNALLGEDRAIVTPVPGTTRDTLEESLSLAGIPVRLTDTAGIREDADSVEEIGIRRAQAKLADADLVWLLVDGSCPITDEDRRLRKLTEKPLLYVVNKIDIVKNYNPAVFAGEFPDLPMVSISAREGAGLKELIKTFASLVVGESEWDPGHTTVPNLRHQAALEKALQDTERVIAGLAGDLSPDLVAIELQQALDHLGEIIGETTTEDILDIIFTQFCLGK